MACRIADVALALVIGLLLLAVTATAGPGDGVILGATKIVDNGPDAERWNLVIVAEGFTDTEQAYFNSVANDLVNDLFLFPPIDSLSDGINVTRLNVASDESGADEPPECGGPGIYVDTYFDASYCNGGIYRLLVVDDGLCISVLNTWVPEWDQAIVLVNSHNHGGSGGTIAVSALAGGWQETVIHEIGHSAFGLADEYEYWAGCGSDTEQDYHPAFEPSEPNVTIETNRELLKWNHLVEPATPIPTTENANCGQCDGQPNPMPEHTVGLYEGAHYYHCDAYRPQFYCMMRDLTEYYCAVCRAEATATLVYYMPAAFTASPRAGAEALTVDFDYASPLPALDWTWYFGDGDSAMVENPTHTYGPGGHDVTLRVSTDVGDRYAFEEDYIVVWADTLTAPEIEARINSAGYWELMYTNAVPIRELVLPIRLTNVMSVLFFDSISFVGTRLDYFELHQIVFDNRFNGELAMRVRADNGGGSPPLAPGSGPIARVHYRIRNNASEGDTSYISTPQLGMHTLKAVAGDTLFAPIFYGATLHVTAACPCVFQSDFDEDGFITAVDLGAEIDILFAGLSDPIDPGCPTTRGDFDCDGFNTALDLGGLIDHLFSGADGPCDPCEK